jgi:predicted nucleic acid-binding protein
VIAVDTNVLVYAHREELPHHRQARAQLTALAEGAARFDRLSGFPTRRL